MGFEVPLKELLERLTMNGLEIEAVSDLGAESGRVVVGKILTRNPHPNAENLSLCTVNTGGAEPLHIVCGASNMQPGDLVPVAIEGARLPGGLVIKKSKIRGETSMGMMCSGRELGFGEDHSGLLLLPRDETNYKIGQPFDALIDIKVTPNRPDCLSVYGIARDVAAAYDKPMPPYPTGDLKEAGAPAGTSVKVRNDASDDCPRYMGRVIRNVKIAPSPLWLTRAVESAGLRSINNVVDVTNFILLELGHPLHAFDMDKIAGNEVVIRLAREGEAVTTLDGQVNTLQSTDLLITDPEKPIALAGIMGCGNTEITDATTNVFLECAYFTPATIRKTSKRLAKSTDSSYRFERGVDWQSMSRVVDRAAALIAEVSGGEVAPGVFDEGKELAAPAAIPFDTARINALLGLSMPADKMTEILRSLGFEVKDGSVMPPAFRPDVTREADLAEEIARIHGYANIPYELPKVLTQPNEFNAEARLARIVRDLFAGAGFLEVVNYSFLSEQSIACAGFDTSCTMQLQNPLSGEYAVLRPSLIPGLLETLVYNQNHGEPEVKLFEVGKVFCKASPDAEANGRDEQGHVSEAMHFAAVIAGPAQPATWRGATRQADFFDGKAVGESILRELGISGAVATTYGVKPEGLLHPGKSAVLAVDNKGLVTIGEIHPALKAKLELKRNAVLIYGDFARLLQYAGILSKYRDIPVFPTVTRDLALVADRSVPSAEIESVIAKRAKSLLSSVKLFDVYEGDKIAADKKSLAYSLQFNARDRTLKDEEVNQLVERILGDLKAKLGVELRA